MYTLKATLWRGVAHDYITVGFMKSAKMTVYLLDLKLCINAKTEDLHPMPDIPQNLRRYWVRKNRPIYIIHFLMPFLLSCSIKNSGYNFLTNQAAFQLIRAHDQSGLQEDMLIKGIYP